MNTKNFFIETWGCQMNEEDSEKLSGMLKSIGYTKTTQKDTADIIIFNTCCVRENAELKVYGNLGMLRKLKKNNPELIIAVCGCMMQQKNMAKDIIKRFPFVDIIFGTHNAYKFPEYLNRVRYGEKSIIEIQNKEDGIVEGIPIDRESNIKGFVTIMYGCNNFCTYCIVPYVRGRERSRLPENIENEIKSMVEKGYKEITLLGQNVNSYGKNLNPKVSFAQLLRRINNIDGIERIRFMTPHPKDFTDDVIEAIKQCDKICEHIHLPVQSGSTRILKKMNRNYSKEQYLKVVDKIKRSIPNVAITTDIIVGFPGETELDFEETLDLAKKVQYDSAFTFIYSKRKGTPADEMGEQISDDIKHERFNRLVDVINNSSAKNNKLYLGKSEEVLVEGLSKNDNTKLMGRTRTGKLVNFLGNSDNIGKLTNVHINSTNSFSLSGEEV
ncbi:tRNA (N6-isopentenyl adenosine(37)-C2)-methylthiotransferase MiaB [Clostridium tyrobutyricum]|jgi:tRNA-2-methylthio-N6-dimethylallyladenosine synthase|uniref:tRNA-2-methylthio-N(6)-dimethylallyladenosine synthase n=1 Tax=Clostridium tyrobutyricum DIVETGP TaxID=1408889 RepID=W6NEK9_CLOTY|nr:tRNA (N6-isopentenyl adenosine(37)-C2)-methylthiotransferase MiaB [Clostridium tyrobutyricum]AND84802.1 tRNA-2-methylthio-N(6)-dimethylallyladenosine synthase [Clostridium tyrobutyricum]ANP69387.1 tRNA (N6-isopentenyl adenosine(37)-C2)-methylthiotransferase MiaB [Clostridium tyrobutyricum]MBR9647690.1 tRNA (N6-isopentenyl adenosine(37)-C2)-methylthiotransferase MiaB [Clostridium tyrobutyricum]MBV4434198.1 tRNA (N6-isopentenyl adenosine(37)-C2)-methylthiotransferase MiaB [Clostridium tyrobuty